MAWRGCRRERFGGGDPRARRPSARAVGAAPAAAAGRPGTAAVRGGRTGAWVAAAADHRRADRGQHPGDRRAGRSRLRHPGPGQHHLLAAVPGRAVGLLQPVTPAKPVPRRPDRMADVRARRRRLRLLGHRGPGHRQRPGSLGDRASHRGGGGARLCRPDPDPAGQGLRLHPAGTDAFRHRRAGPRHPRRPVPPARPGGPAARRAAAAAAPGRHLAAPAGHPAAT